MSRLSCARCKPFITILRLRGVLYVRLCILLFCWFVVSLKFIPQFSIFHVYMLSRSLYGWQLLWPVHNFNQLGLQLLKITWKNKNPRAITLRKIIRPHTCYVTHHCNVYAWDIAGFNHIVKQQTPLKVPSFIYTHVIQYHATKSVYARDKRDNSTLWYSIILHYTLFTLRDKRDNSTLWYSIILHYTLHMLRDKSDNSTLWYSIMLHYTLYMLRDKRDNSTLW